MRTLRNTVGQVMMQLGGLVFVLGCFQVLLLLVSLVTDRRADPWPIVESALWMIVPGGAALGLSLLIVVPDPPAATSRDLSLLDNVPALLATLGLPMDGRITTPERALQAGMIQAGLVRA